MTHQLRFVGGPIPSSVKAIVEAPTTTSFSALTDEVEALVRKATGDQSITITTLQYNIVELEMVSGGSPKVKGHLKWNDTPASSALPLKAMIMLQVKTRESSIGSTMMNNQQPRQQQVRIVGGPIGKSTKLVLQVRSSDDIRSLFPAAEIELRGLEPSAGPITEALYELVDLEMVEGKPKMVKILKDDTVLASIKLSSGVLMLKPRSSGSRPVSRAESVHQPIDCDIHVRVLGGPIPKDGRLFVTVNSMLPVTKVMDIIGVECKRQGYGNQVDSDNFDLGVLEVVEGKPKVNKLLAATDSLAASMQQGAQQMMVLLKPKSVAVPLSDSRPGTREGDPNAFNIRFVGGPIERSARVFVATSAETPFAKILEQLSRTIGQNIIPREYDLVELIVVDGKPSPARTLELQKTPAQQDFSSKLIMLKPATEQGPSRVEADAPQQPQATKAPVVEPKSEPAVQPAVTVTNSDYKIRVVGGPIPKAARLSIDVNKTSTTFADMIVLVRREAAKLDPSVTVGDDFEFVELDMSEGKPKPRQVLRPTETAASSKMESPCMMLKVKAPSNVSPSVSRPASALSALDRSATPMAEPIVVAPRPLPSPRAVVSPVVAATVTVANPDYKVRVVGAPIPKAARLFIEVSKAVTTFADMLTLVQREAAKLEPSVVVGEDFEFVELDMSEGKPKPRQVLRPAETAASSKMTSPVMMLKVKNAPTTSPSVSRPGSALSALDRSVTPVTEPITATPARPTATPSVLAVSPPSTPAPLTVANPDFKVRVVGGPIPKAARLFIEVAKANTTFADMLQLVQQEAAKLKPSVPVGDDFEFVELDMSDGKPKPKQVLRALETAASSKMTSPVMMLKAKAAAGVSPSISRPGSALSAIDRPVTPAVEPAVIAASQPLKSPRAASVPAAQSIPTDFKVRVIGGPIPKAARLFIDVAKATTTFSDMLLIVQREAAKLDPSVTVGDEFEFVELDMKDGKPKPRQILRPHETVNSSKMTSPVMMLKAQTNAPADTSRPGSALSALGSTPSAEPAATTLPLESPRAVSVATPAALTVANPDFKVRVVGGPIPKAARLFIEVAKANTTFADMLQLVHQEAAKLEPSVPVGDDFEFVELDMSDGKPKPKQVLRALETAASSKMTSPVMMLKAKAAAGVSPSISRPASALERPITPAVEPAVIVAAPPLKSPRAALAQTATAVVETKKAPVFITNPDFKVRVVGGPIPKAARLFIDVAKATTTFSDMLLLVQHEAGKLDPPVALGDDFEFVELDMSDGKPKPKQVLRSSETASSSRMTSNVMMLKTSLAVGVSPAMTPRASPLPSPRATSVDYIRYEILCDGVQRGLKIEVALPRGSTYNGVLPILCREIAIETGVHHSPASILESFELVEVLIAASSGMRKPIRTLDLQDVAVPGTGMIELLPVVSGSTVRDADQKVRVVGGPILKSDRVYVDVNRSRTTFSQMTRVIIAKLQELSIGSLTADDASSLDLVEVDVEGGRSVVRGVLHPAATIDVAGMKSNIIMIRRANDSNEGPGLSRPSTPRATSTGSTTVRYVVRVVGGPIPRTSRIFVEMTTAAVTVADAFHLIQDFVEREVPGVSVEASDFDLIELDMTTSKPKPLRILPMIQNLNELSLPLKPVWALKPKHRSAATPQVTPQVSPRASPQPSHLSSQLPQLNSLPVRLRFVGGPIAKAARVILEVDANEALKSILPLVAQQIEALSAGDQTDFSQYDIFDLDMSDPTRPVARAMLFPQELIRNCIITSGVLLLKKKENVPMLQLQAAATIDAPPPSLPAAASPTDSKDPSEIRVEVRGVPGVNFPITVSVSKFIPFKDYFAIIEKASQDAKGNALGLPPVEIISATSYDIDMIEHGTGEVMKALNLFESAYSEDFFSGAIRLKERAVKSPRIPKLALGGGGSALTTVSNMPPLRSPRISQNAPVDDEHSGMRLSNFDLLRREDEPLRSPRPADNNEGEKTTIRVIGSPIPRGVKIFIEVLQTTFVSDWYAMIREQMRREDAMVAQSITEDRFDIMELELDDDANQRPKRALPSALRLRELSMDSPIVMIQAKENRIPAATRKTSQSPTRDSSPSLLAANNDASPQPQTPRRLAPMDTTADVSVSMSPSASRPAASDHEVRLRIIGHPIPKDERFFVFAPENSTFASVFPRLTKLMNERMPGYPPFSERTHEFVELHKDAKGKKKVKRVLPVDLTIYEADLDMHILKVRERDDPMSPVKRAPDSTDVTPMPSPRPPPTLDRRSTMAPGMGLHGEEDGHGDEDEAEHPVMQGSVEMLPLDEDVPLVEVRILGPQIGKGDKVIVTLEANKTIAALFPLIHERVIRLKSVDRSAVVPVTSENFDLAEAKKESGGKRKARGALDLWMKLGMLSERKPILKLRYKDESLRALSVSPAVSQQVTPRGSPEEPHLHVVQHALHSALEEVEREQQRQAYKPNATWVVNTVDHGTQTTGNEVHAPHLLIQMPTMAIGDDFMEGGLDGMSAAPLREVQTDDASTQTTIDQPLAGVNLVSKVRLLRNTTPNELLRELNELLREALVDGRRALFEFIVDNNEIQVPLVADAPERFDRSVQAIPVSSSRAQATETDAVEVRHKSVETEMPQVVNKKEVRRQTEEYGVQVSPIPVESRSIGCTAATVDTEDEWTMTVPQQTRHQGVETEILTHTTSAQTDIVPEWLAHPPPAESTPAMAQISPTRDFSNTSMDDPFGQNSPMYGRRQSMAAARVETLINDEQFSQVKSIVLDERDSVADAKLRERLRLLEQAKRDIDAKLTPKDAAAKLSRPSVSHQQPMLHASEAEIASSDSGPDEEELEERRKVRATNQRMSSMRQTVSPPAPALAGNSGRASQSFARKNTLSSSQQRQASVVMFGDDQQPSSGSVGPSSNSLGRSGSMFAASPVRKASIRNTAPESSGQRRGLDREGSIRLPAITPEPQQSRALPPPDERLERSFGDSPLVDEEGSPVGRRQSMRRTSLDVANQSRSFRASKASQSFKITPRLQNTMEELMKKWQQ